MPGFDHSVLTDVGWNALGDAEAGKHIEYTHLEAGDGYMYGGDTEAFGLTALKHKVMNFPITNFSNDGQGQITLVGVISSKNVITGFQFREIGVKCTIDGGPEILYAVANAGDTADYMPGSAESGVVIQTVQIVIKIDRASNVTVVIQPGLDVTAANIGPATVGPGYFRDKQGQILYFKRINSPKKSLILSETADLVSIDIPVVDVNLDMWVAIGNPDIFPNFSTIQKALDYLIPLRINPGIFVTIHVAAGVWVNAATTTVDHRDGTQIKIVGTTGTVKNVVTTSGTSTLVTLGAAAGTFSDMAVGDYFLYKNWGRVEGMAVSGIWKVQAKAADGSSISYNPGWWGLIFPALGPVTGGTVTPLKTVIQSAPNSTGFYITNVGLGLLQNMAIVGDANANAYGVFAVAGESRFESVGTTNWYAQPGHGGGGGFGASVTGFIDCYDCAACRNGYGFNCGHSGSKIETTTCFANSNDVVGFSVYGSQFEVVTSSACGNKGNGFSCAGNGIFIADNLYCAYNRQNGFSVNAAGNVSIIANTTGLLSALGSNGIKDVSLSVCAIFARANGPAVSYGTVNIAPNALSYDGCWFSP